MEQLPTLSPASKQCLGSSGRKGAGTGFDSIIRGQIEVKEAGVSQMILLTRRTLHQMMGRDG